MSNVRIAANRANAQRSTGPKTDLGKAASSRNAIRHGLTGKQVVINGEDPAAYEALRQDLIASYQPANAAESTLVDEIAQCFWRLQRARALEAEQFNLCCGGADPIIGFNSGNADFDRLRRYMTSIERAYHRAIEQLQKLQRLRFAAQPPSPLSISPEITTPVAALASCERVEVHSGVSRDSGFGRGSRISHPAGRVLRVEDQGLRNRDFEVH